MILFNKKANSTQQRPLKFLHARKQHSFQCQECWKLHFRASRFQIFLCVCVCVCGGACPQTPLGERGLALQWPLITIVIETPDNDINQILPIAFATYRHDLFKPTEVNYMYVRSMIDGSKTIDDRLSRVDMLLQQKWALFNKKKRNSLSIKETEIHVTTKENYNLESIKY